MNGAKLRARLLAGDSTPCSIRTMSPGLSVRLVELGADPSSSLIASTGPRTRRCLDNRQVTGPGGAAIVRPHSHERPVLIRYLNAGADGIMVPMVDTVDQARAVVDAVRYALPSDHEKRLVVSIVETLEAIDNLNEMLAVRWHRCVLHRPW